MREFINDLRFSLFDMCILAVICFVMTLTIVVVYSEINKDLAEQVEYYKTMYYEKDVAVKILQQKCGVE